MSLTWNTLSQYHKQPPTEALHRNHTIQINYNQYMAMNRSTIAREITNKYLADVEMVAYKPNTFPYDVSPDIVHLLAWFVPLYKREVREKLVEADLFKCGIRTPVREYILFENYSDNQSIATIPHIHLFINKNYVSDNQLARLFALSR